MPTTARPSALPRKSALHTSGAVDRKADAAGKVGFLLWGWIPEPYTLYAGIRALPAGSWMIVNDEGTRSSGTSCRISDEIAEAEKRSSLLSNEEVSARLRSAMLDTVASHMIADVPVGVFLSSGIDSTSLTALARETSGSRLHTRLRSDSRNIVGLKPSEVPLAETVARQLGTTHQTRWVSRSEFHADLAAVLAAMDQPSVDGVNTYFVGGLRSRPALRRCFPGWRWRRIIRRLSGAFGKIPQLVHWEWAISRPRRRERCG